MRAIRRMYRTELGSKFSEGARLFWLALQCEGKTMAQATRELDAPGGQVNRWLYGDKRPPAEWSAKIEDVYGVPAGEWGRPPRLYFAPPASAAA